MSALLLLLLPSGSAIELLLLLLFVGSKIIALSPPVPVLSGEELEGLELLEVPPVTGANVAPSLFGAVGVGAGAGAGAGAEAVALVVGPVSKPLLAEALALLEVPPVADAV